MSTLHPSSFHRPHLPSPRLEPSAARVQAIVHSLHEAAVGSASFLAYEAGQALADGIALTRILLLGPRGGDQPIRLGLFAGFEARELASVQLLARLLLQLKERRHHTADFALIGYPVVNARSFTEPAFSLGEFESAFARETTDPVVNFYRDEFRRWTFHGLIHLRTRPGTRALHATVRSDTIATEVLAPALAAVATALPVDPHPVRVRPGDRYARAADFSEGRFGVPPEVRPYPFEIELFLPEQGNEEDSIGAGVFRLVTELLRLYRALLAHAPNL